MWRCSGIPNIVGNLPPFIPSQWHPIPNSQHDALRATQIESETTSMAAGEGECIRMGHLGPTANRSSMEKQAALPIGGRTLLYSF